MKNLKSLIDAMNEKIKEGVLQTKCVDEFLIDFFDYETHEKLHDEIEIESVQFSEIDEHRWYGLQDIVFKITYQGESAFVDNTLITQSYSESQSYCDIGHYYRTFHYVYPKEKIITVYERTLEND